MRTTRRHFVLSAAAFGGALVLGRDALAAPPPDKDGYVLTGDGVRTKSVAFVSVDVYAIRHEMKTPPARSKRAVIDADVDKRFVWRMLRSVEAEKIHGALRDAFKLNGYGDQGKIGALLAAFSGELKKGASVVLQYDSAAKTVTARVQGGGTATVAGADFMKAVWSIWLGNIDPPSLGDQLIRNL